MRKRDGQQTTTKPIKCHLSLTWFGLSWSIVFINGADTKLFGYSCLHMEDQQISNDGQRYKETSPMYTRRPGRLSGFGPWGKVGPRPFVITHLTQIKNLGKPLIAMALTKNRHSALCCIVLDIKLRMLYVLASKLFMMVISFIFILHSNYKIRPAAWSYFWLLERDSVGS